ncbi:MAG: diguanylate cyclase [Nitrospirota bacterium]
MKFSIHRKLFLSLFFAVLLVSGSIGTYFYLSAVDSLMQSLQDRLKYSAALISDAVDAAHLTGIRRHEDTTLPEYQETLLRLRGFRRTNPDIAYLYIMRRENDRIFFVIDSDETDRQALPGKEYSLHLPSLVGGFVSPSVDPKIYIDEWGSFMSGYAPLKNGKGQYLVGIDMRADEVKKKLHNLRISGILSLAASIVLAIVFSRLLSRHFTTPIQLLVSYCEKIAAGRAGEQLEFRTGDELENLINAFNTMSARIEESREQNRKAGEALRQAKEGLEGRVSERTKELQELNEKLIREIADREKAEQMLAQAATSDPLTGLMNRRAILEQLRYQVIRYGRNKSPFVILLTDLDHFKKINDSYGHDAGDRVLVAVTGHLLSSIRSQDMVSRWGGEEFLILLPDTDLKGGAHAAEKMRRYLADQTFKEGSSSFHLTLSIGVAEYRDGQDLDDCIKTADRALYEAKKQGRDRVVVSG